MDTTNDFAVSTMGEKIIIMRLNAVLTKAEALRMAAWLVSLADDKNQFNEVLDAVQNT